MTELFSTPSAALGAALEAVTTEGARVYITRCYVASTVAPTSGEYIAVTGGGVLAKIHATPEATAIRSVSPTEAINILRYHINTTTNEIKLSTDCPGNAGA